MTKKATIKTPDPWLEGTKVFLEGVELQSFEAKQSDDGKELLIEVPIPSSKSEAKRLVKAVINRSVNLMIVTGSMHFRASASGLFAKDKGKMELRVPWTQILSRRADRSIEEEDFLDLDLELSQ